MGLGKTLSLISLVIQKKDEGVEEWLAKPPAKEGEHCTTPSLRLYVVCCVSKA